MLNSADIKTVLKFTPISNYRLTESRDRPNCIIADNKSKVKCIYIYVLFMQNIMCVDVLI